MTENQHQCQCSCGETKFIVNGLPLMRGFCHCSICQEYNQAPFADISVYRARDVVLHDPQSVEYKAYKPPPAVQRGKCKSCGKPAIETMHIFPLPKLVIIPTINLHKECLIDPALHVFYDRRVSEIEDDLPKYNGYLKSQLAFGKKLVAALMRRSPKS